MLLPAAEFWVDVVFDNSDLDRLEVDVRYRAGLNDPLVKSFRKAMQHIRAATDERTFYARKSFHFEKLSGDRQGQHSMRLNDQWRLILKIEGEAPAKRVRVIGIVDYH